MIKHFCDCCGEELTTKNKAVLAMQCLINGVLFRVELSHKYYNTYKSLCHCEMCLSCVRKIVDTGYSAE